MKTTLLAIAVAAVVATVLSFGAARWFAGMHKAPPAIPTVNDVEWLKRELSLNESQVGELRKYEAGFQEKFRALLGTLRRPAGAGRRTRKITARSRHGPRVC